VFLTWLSATLRRRGTRCCIITLTVTRNNLVLLTNSPCLHLCHVPKPWSANCLTHSAGNEDVESWRAYCRKCLYEDSLHETELSGSALLWGFTTAPEPRDVWRASTTHLKQHTALLPCAVLFLDFLNQLQRKA
jgi:hypothetical protein